MNEYIKLKLPIDNILSLYQRKKHLREYFERYRLATVIKFEFYFTKTFVLIVEAADLGFHCSPPLNGYICGISLHLSLNFFCDYIDTLTSYQKQLLY